MLVSSRLAVLRSLPGKGHVFGKVLSVREPDNRVIADPCTQRNGAALAIKGRYMSDFTRRRYPIALAESNLPHSKSAELAWDDDIRGLRSLERMAFSTGIGRR